MNVSPYTRTPFWLSLFLGIITACCTQNIIAMDYNWEQPFRKTVTLEGHTAEILIIQASPDESFVLTADVKGVAKIWDTNLGICIHTLHDKDVSSLQCATIKSDGSMIALAHNNYVITLWDTATGTCVKKFQNEVSYPAFEMHFSSFTLGKTSIPCIVIATVGGIACYDYIKDKYIYCDFAPKRNEKPYSMALDAQLHVLAIGDSKTHTTQIYDLLSQKIIANFESPIKSTTPSSIFSSQNHLLASFNRYKIMVWDVPTKTLLADIDSSSITTRVPYYAYFSSNNTNVIVDYDDDTTIIWNISTKKPLALVTNMHKTALLNISPDNMYAIIASPETAALFNIASSQTIKKLNYSKQKSSKTFPTSHSSGKFITSPCNNPCQAALCYFYKKLFHSSQQSIIGRAKQTSSDIQRLSDAKFHFV